MQVYIFVVLHCSYIPDIEISSSAYFSIKVDSYETEMYYFNTKMKCMAKSGSIGCYSIGVAECGSQGIMCNINLKANHAIKWKVCILNLGCQRSKELDPQGSAI